MSIKLIKACKELNIGMSTAVEFCKKQGRAIATDPNTRLEDDLYLLLAKEFNKKIALKLEAESNVQKCKEYEIPPIDNAQKNNEMEYAKHRDLTIGQIVVGTVSNIVGYGVFVKGSSDICVGDIIEL